MVDSATAQIPSISPLAGGIRQPLWSVMIPNYNSGEYLRKTLESVLTQDAGPERMQIEVVDHCSTEGDPEKLVRDVCGNRVAFYRRPKNEGPIANFNACIQRSRGHLIHILHSDDYVLPGFYAEIERLAELHADVALLATRCFLVDETDIIINMTERLRDLEGGGRSIESLYYNHTSMLFPGRCYSTGILRSSRRLYAVTRTYYRPGDVGAGGLPGRRRHLRQCVCLLSSL